MNLISSLLLRSSSLASSLSEKGIRGILLTVYLGAMGSVSWGGQPEVTRLLGILTEMFAGGIIKAIPLDWHYY